MDTDRGLQTTGPGVLQERGLDGAGEVKMTKEAPLPKNDCVSCQDFHRGIGVSHNHCDNRHPYNSDGDSRANGHSSVDGVFQDCPFRTSIPDDWVIGKSRADGQIANNNDDTPEQIEEAKKHWKRYTKGGKTFAPDRTGHYVECL